MIRRTLFTIVLSGLLMAALAGPATAAGGGDYLAIPPGRVRRLLRAGRFGRRYP